MASRTRVPTSSTPISSTRPIEPSESDRRFASIRTRASLRSQNPEQIRRRRRTAVALASLLSALGMTWLLYDQGAQGRPTSWLYDGLDWFTGAASFVLPVLLGAAGIAILADQRKRLPTLWQLIGAILIVGAVAGLMGLAANTVDDGGGEVGAAFVSLLSRWMREIPSAFVFLLVGTAGVFLITRTTPWGLIHEIRIAIGAEPDPMQPVPSPAPKVSSAPIQPAPTPSEKKPAPAAKKPEPAPPVINMPTAKRTAPAPRPEPNGADVKAGDKLPVPDLSKLKQYETIMPEQSLLEANARTMEETLDSFRVDATVREINPGPTVTQYTLEPGSGVKVRRITELQNDLALALAASSIRIEAPVPGMARVGIEIPNEEVSTVGLRETIEAPEFKKSKTKLPVPLGRDVNGRYVVGDLTKMPHLLIAGATGSGKSVCINCVISTFLLTRSPNELKLLMIDPKMVELGGYNGVPHLQCPVITEMDKVVGALKLVVREMQRRYDLFNQASVRNLEGYRMKVADEPKSEKIPYLVVIVDELADLMLTAPVEVEELLQRIAQMGRAAGIHLILATQRPSVDVLTGVIKANVPARIAFAVSSLTDSRVILDLPGAERLLGKGDMLYLPPDAAKPFRVQGAFIDDRDVKYLVKHWHSVAPIPDYAEEWINLPSSSKSQGSVMEFEDDPLMDDALEVVMSQGVASASMLQRRLRIGYNRAARIVEQMEADGIVGPADGSKGRPVLRSVDVEE